MLSLWDFEFEFDNIAAKKKKSQLNGGLSIRLMLPSNQSQQQREKNGINNQIERFFTIFFG